MYAAQYVDISAVIFLQAKVGTKHMCGIRGGGYSLLVSLCCSPVEISDDLSVTLFMYTIVGSVNSCRDENVYNLLCCGFLFGPAKWY
jgi:hypothetical protein